MTRISQTYDELSIGDTASITRIVTPDDLYVFAHVSGNLNPLHLPGSRSGKTQSGQNPAPSMLQIPMHRGHLLRFDRGQATDLMAATIPI